MPPVERTFFIARSTEGSGATVGVKYPRNRGTPVTSQNSGYDQFPLAANILGTIHPIPDKAPPIQAKVEGAPT
jgi:hypothetical protein